MVSSRLPISNCPSCGSELDMATGLESKPEPGDLSVCIQCSSLNAFTSTMFLRLATDDELASLDPANRQLLNEYVNSIKVRNRLKMS